MVIVGGFITANKINLPEYAITPGDATPVAPLVTINGVATMKHHDKIMLTDVYLQQMTALQWLQLHFQKHVEFIPESYLLSPGVPAQQLDDQGYLEMADSKQMAEVAAFRALGWKVPQTDAGAVLTQVTVPSPSSKIGLNVGDRITAVNGKAVTSACSMISLISPLAPGSKVTLEVDRAKYSNTGVLNYTKVQTLHVTTKRPPGGLAATQCPGTSAIAHSWIGIGVEDGFSYQFPALVSINTANIGGPSAGLAMTLTLIDLMSKHPLAAGAPIAATGTMDQFGNVGDVGGVAEKTVAIQRAGAKYFIVPQVEVATAQSAASPGLKIIGVTTLDQALRDLRAIGGQALSPITRPH